VQCSGYVFPVRWWKELPSVIPSHLSVRAPETCVHSLSSPISIALLSILDFQPCNSKVLATHKVLVDSFRSIYPINNGTPNGSAVAIGRYPEDTYYNGNPWYLCTLAAAELLYDAVAQFNRSGRLTIDSTNQAFFKGIHPPANLGSHTGSNMQSILNSMAKYADGFVSVVEVN
jgi:glucoamylase